MTTRNGQRQRPDVLVYSAQDKTPESSDAKVSLNAYTRLYQTAKE